MPFAQLALCLAGAASLGLVVERLAAPDLAALGLVLLAILHGDANSRVLRSWIELELHRPGGQGAVAGVPPR